MRPLASSNRRCLIPEGQLPAPSPASSDASEGPLESVDSIVRRYPLDNALNTISRRYGLLALCSRVCGAVRSKFAAAATHSLNVNRRLAIGISSSDASAIQQTSQPPTTCSSRARISENIIQISIGNLEVKC